MSLNKTRNQKKRYTRKNLGKKKTSNKKRHTRNLGKKKLSGKKRHTRKNLRKKRMRGGSFFVPKNTMPGGLTEKDRQLVLAAIEKKQYTLINMDNSEGTPSIKVTTEADTESGEEGGRELSYMFPEPFNDREILEKVVKNPSEEKNRSDDPESWGIVNYASKELKNDRDFMMNVVTSSPEAAHALQFASPALQNDYELVMKAVKQDGDVLKHASSDLKDNLNIVREAVMNDGSALQYASKLKDNKNFVEKIAKLGDAAGGRHDPLKYASERVKEIIKKKGERDNKKENIE